MSTIYRIGSKLVPVYAIEVDFIETGEQSIIVDTDPTGAKEAEVDYYRDMEMQIEREQSDSW